MQGEPSYGGNPFLTSQLQQYGAETVFGLIAFFIPIIFVIASLVFYRIKPVDRLNIGQLQLGLICIGCFCLMFCFSTYQAILPVYNQYTIRSFFAHVFEAAVTR